METLYALAIRWLGHKNQIILILDKHLATKLDRRNISKIIINNAYLIPIHAKLWACLKQHLIN